MNIVNKHLGISSKKIKECNDKFKLLDWKTMLSIHIIDLKEQIDEYKKRRVEGDENLDYGWFIRLKKYTRLQGTLFHEINFRLSALKSNNKRIHIERDFWKSKCKEKYSEVDFQQLHNELHEDSNFKKEESFSDWSIVEDFKACANCKDSDACQTFGCGICM